MSVAKPSDTASWSASVRRKHNRGPNKAGNLRKVSDQATQRMSPPAVVTRGTPSPALSRSPLQDDDVFRPSLGGRENSEQSVVSGTAEAAAAIARSSSSQTPLGPKMALRVYRPVTLIEGFVYQRDLLMFRRGKSGKCILLKEEVALALSLQEGKGLRRKAYS